MLRSIVCIVYGMTLEERERTTSLSSGRLAVRDYVSAIDVLLQQGGYTRATKAETQWRNWRCGSKACVCALSMLAVARQCRTTVIG